MHESVAPIRSPSNDLPSPPMATITRNAMPMPGKVAWLSASLTRERLRKSKNVPTTPADNPSSMTPTVTRIALK